MYKVLFALFILIGIGLRLNGIFSLKQGLSMDESVSYLCASGTQGKFKNSEWHPADSLITARQVQRYYQRPDEPQFRQIANDLVQYDIHPPLYFWALHLIQYAFGFSMLNGVILNLIFSILLGSVIYHLAIVVLQDERSAMIAVILWSLSPAVVQIDLEARHYQLLALLAISSVWLTLKYLAKPTTLTLISIAFVNAAGLLTHYYYGFIILPGIYLAWRQLGTKGIIPYVISTFLSFMLFLAAFPEFLDFPARYLQKSTDASQPNHLVERIRSFLYNSLEFFTYWRSIRYVILLILIGSFAVLVFQRFKKSRYDYSVSDPVNLISGILLWFVAFTFILYIAGISPQFAVGEQYFSYIWPLLAIVLVLLVRRMLGMRIASIVFLIYCVHLSIACHQSIVNSRYVQPVLPHSWFDQMNNGQMIVTNVTDRAYLPRIATHLEPHVPLFFTSTRAKLPVTDNYWILTYADHDISRIIPRSQAIQSTQKIKYPTNEEFKFYSVR